MRLAAGSAERQCCFTFRAVNRGSRAGELDTACIAIEGSRAACGEALSFGSAAASLQCVTPPELQAAAASAVPNAFGSVRHHAFCCFPGFGVRGGEAKNGLKGLL
jgi:hypothetical protein